MTVMIGLDAGYDPTWPAGFLYVRNVVRTLASLPSGERPEVRLLPVNTASIERLEDLFDHDFVSIAGGTSPKLMGRRLKRRFIQPLTGRPLDRAFTNLDATFPGFGRPIPRVTQVDWIPDFQHVHLRELFSDKEVRARDRRFASIAARRGVVVLSSDAARADFVDRYPDAAAEPRVWRFVTQLTEKERTGANPRPRFGLPDFFLHVANQFWAHKEHDTLFKALVRLRQTGLTPTVVCTGLMEDARNPGHVEDLIRFVEREGLGEQVRFLGMLDRADQISVMRYSAAVVQPSRFEGWSTVVEDAKAVGRPIVLSDLAVHREQEPGASFFQVGSAASLAATLEDVLPRLRPGPDEAVEAAARAATNERTVRAARLFVEIMNEAIAIDHTTAAE